MRFAFALAASVAVHAAAGFLLRGRIPSESVEDASVGVREITLAVVRPTESSRCPSPRDEQLTPQDGVAPSRCGPPTFAASADPDGPPPQAEDPVPAPEEPPAKFSDAAAVDAPARPACEIRPRYPRGARSRGEEGDVTVEAAVGSDGRVIDAEIVRSSRSAELDAAALKAVRESRFRPARSGNRAVASLVRLPIRFRLSAP